MLDIRTLTNRSLLSSTIIELTLKVIMDNLVDDGAGIDDSGRWL